MKLLLQFFMFGGFTGSSFKRGQTFHHLVYPPLLDYDVSMCEVVELVFVIPTSPRSSKIESECKSYHHFRAVDFSRPDNPPKFGPDNPPL
jgi:hypothetical protein